MPTATPLTLLWVQSVAPLTRQPIPTSLPRAPQPPSFLPPHSFICVTLGLVNMMINRMGVGM